MSDYPIAEDIRLVADFFDFSVEDIAEGSGIRATTLFRWLSGESKPSAEYLSRFYDYAFRRGVPINRIREQLLKEQVESSGGIALFHGAKNVIEGPLSLDKSRPNNDFGRGFYCGESFEQSAMFVSAFPSSSVYAFAFDPSGLMGLDFHVDQRWMLAIAWFRGWLGDYAEHPLVIEVREQVKTADYVTAPIADNSMFNTVNAFIEGEITDIQCQHSLSATNLGRQYVCLSPRALDALEMRQRCFLPESEKASYLETRRQESAVSNSKAKEAKRLFRNEGRYIEEVLS